MSVATMVRADAAAAGFAIDRDQRRLLAALGRGGSVYAYGDVGRGKTWLLDAWFDALPTQAKRRVHFHRYFRDLHEKIIGTRYAVDAAIDELLDGVEVLYFDELHVHDPGDATLLIPLLRKVFERDIAFVTSSNYAPGGLVPDPGWHPLFEPGIELIAANMEIVELKGRTDYRTIAGEKPAGFGSGRWVAPDSLADLGLVVPSRADRAVLEVRGRSFDVATARGEELWITFEQLAVVATSPIEYAEWAERFPTWVVTGVPSFEEVGEEVQQRFINAIDVLCDLDIRLIVTSELSFEAFVAAAGERPDAFRMISRLHLLA